MSGLPILAYHSLDSSGSVISTSPAWFRATMSALRAEGVRCVDLRDWICAGRPAVDRGFAITFDDGLSSLRIAADAIARQGFTATAFLVSGRMGTDNVWPGQPASIPRLRLLDWPDLDDLATAGFRFGAHTVSHPRLGRCNPSEIDRQIIDSRLQITERLGIACPLFAYPYGDAPRRARETVKSDFTGGFGTALAFASAEDDVALLPRVDAYYLKSASDLERLISGRWEAWLRARQIARKARGAIAVARSAVTGYGSRRGHHG